MCRFHFEDDDLRKYEQAFSESDFDDAYVDMNLILGKFSETLNFSFTPYLFIYLFIYYCCFLRCYHVIKSHRGSALESIVSIR